MKLIDKYTQNIIFQLKKYYCYNWRNVIIDWWNFFDEPIKNDFKIYDNIRKIAPGPGDYYTTGYLLDYNYFKAILTIANCNRFK